MAICRLYCDAVHRVDSKIPDELYEAARLDGAGKIQQFFHITVPQTKEMSFVAVVMTLTGAFTVFNEPYILTGGGPGKASEVLSTFLYKSAFTKDMMATPQRLPLSC